MLLCPGTGMGYCGRDSHGLRSGRQRRGDGNNRLIPDFAHEDTAVEQSALLAGEVKEVVGILRHPRPFKALSQIYRLADAVGFIRVDTLGTRRKCRSEPLGGIAAPCAPLGGTAGQNSENQQYRDIWRNVT